MKKKTVNIVLIGVDVDDCIEAANGIHNAIGFTHWSLCGYLISDYIPLSKGNLTLTGESSGNTVVFRPASCNTQALRKAYEAERDRSNVDYDKVLGYLGLSKIDLKKRSIFIDLTADPEIGALMDRVLGFHKKISAPFVIIHGVINEFTGLTLACMRGQSSAKIVLDHKIAPAELATEKEFRPIAENFFSCNDEDPWLEPVGHLLETASALLCTL